MWIVFKNTYLKGKFIHLLNSPIYYIIISPIIIDWFRDKPLVK